MSSEDEDPGVQMARLVSQGTDVILAKTVLVVARSFKDQMRQAALNSPERQGFTLGEFANPKLMMTDPYVHASVKRKIYKAMYGLGFPIQTEAGIPIGLDRGKVITNEELAEINAAVSDLHRNLETVRKDPGKKWALASIKELFTSYKNSEEFLDQKAEKQEAKLRKAEEMLGFFQK